MKYLVLFISLVSYSYAGVVQDLSTNTLTSLITSASSATSLKASKSAIETTSRALTESPIIAEQLRLLEEARKKIEEKIYGAIEEQLGIKKNRLAYIYTIGTALINGEFDSSKVKYNIRYNGVSIRPDLYYNWRSNDYGVSINFNYRF